MRAITHKLCFDLAEDLLYDLNEYGVQVRLGGSVNLGDWFKVRECNCVDVQSLYLKLLLSNKKSEKVTTQ